MTTLSGKTANWCHWLIDKERLPAAWLMASFFVVPVPILSDIRQIYPAFGPNTEFVKAGLSGQLGIWYIPIFISLCLVFQPPPLCLVFQPPPPPHNKNRWWQITPAHECFCCFFSTSTSSRRRCLTGWVWAVSWSTLASGWTASSGWCGQPPPAPPSTRHRE